MIIHAALYGIKNALTPPPASNIIFADADAETLKLYNKLPSSLEEAARIAKISPFVNECLPKNLVDMYCKAANGLN